MKMDRSFKNNKNVFFDVPVSDTSSNYRGAADKFYGADYGNNQDQRLNASNTIGGNF